MKRLALALALVSMLLIGLLASPVLAAARGNGPSTYIPAYYDGKLYTTSFMELPSKAEMATEMHNNSKNIIYQYDPGIAPGVPFISVLDAIPGDGFNPLWEEWQITFLTITPQQFLSDNDILAAEQAGQISLTDTDEMYICAVVGFKK